MENASPADTRSCVASLQGAPTATEVSADHVLATYNVGLVCIFTDITDHKTTSQSTGMRGRLSVEYILDSASKLSHVLGAGVQKRRRTDPARLVVREHEAMTLV